MSEILDTDPSLGTTILSLMQAAMECSQRRLNQQQFLDFCLGIWESVEMNDNDELADFLAKACRRHLKKK